MIDDSALDDFLSRFGDTQTTQTKQKPVSTLKPAGFSDSITSGIQQAGLLGRMKDPIKEAREKIIGKPETALATNGDASGLLDKASNIGGKVLDAAPSALALIDNFKGGQFDTSADGDGPGKAGGAIMQGAAQGKQLADSLGLKDPISQGVGLLGGALVSTFAHKGAMKKYRKNQVRKNLQENALEKAERAEEYAMAQGLESMENLKALRQKQLGVIL